MQLAGEWWKASKPLTVASVATQEDIDFLCSNPAPADLVELRLDILVDLGIDVSTTLNKLNSHNLLITARCATEGGIGELSESGRRILLLDALPYASAVDIEVKNLEAFADIVTAAKQQNVPVIGSFHDFGKTPAASVYADVIATAQTDKVDIFKCAARLHTLKDLQVLIDLFTNTNLPLAAMGMGALGPSSRVILAQHGSLLNYGYVTGTPTAPGQWPTALLRDAILNSPQISAAV